jgi:hypothetical protein
MWCEDRAGVLRVELGGYKPRVGGEFDDFHKACFRIPAGGHEACSFEPVEVV